MQRGWAYADMGQWGKASADFIKAAECKEPHEEAWYSRAMLHLRDGNLERLSQHLLGHARALRRGGDLDLHAVPESPGPIPIESYRWLKIC